MKNRLPKLLLAAIVFTATNVWAQDEESFTNYEAIVNELKASADYEPPRTEPDLNWDEVALQGGMSIVTSFVNINAPGSGSGSGMLKGFEAHAGANLFTRQVRGEIAFRTFAPEDLSGGLHVNLRELETRLIFLPVLADKMLLRMGFGFTARYMDLDAKTFHGSETTPASALILGFEHKLSRAVSVGPDIAYRSALSDTFDKSAWDAAIRLNASF